MDTMTIIVMGVAGMSIVLNLQYMSFFKKFPFVREMQKANKKGLQLAIIHDPEGSCTAIPISILPGSNQLDFGKEMDKFGIKFKPRGMNEAEFIDRKIATFHYMGAFPHALPVPAISAMSRVKRVVEQRGINITQEKLNTVMNRDLSKPKENIRATMVPGSEARISDAELDKMSRVQKELQSTKSNSTGPFVFNDCHDFLHSIGMSAAVSLREWKSYVTTLARGEIATKAFMLDAKSLGMIAIMLAIAYVISKSGSIGNITNLKV